MSTATLRELLIYNLPLLEDEINKIDRLYLDIVLNRNSKYRSETILDILSKFSWFNSPQGRSFWNDVATDYCRTRLLWP